MEVKIKNNEIVVKHKLKRNETYKISQGSKIQALSIFKKPQIVGGFSNICEDLKCILTIDYDQVEFNVVFEDYMLIQEIYKLPQAYFFKTKEGNYHVICLKKFYSAEIAEILSKTRCDSNYKDMPLRNKYRSWVLRISDKNGSKRPKYIGKLGELIFNNLNFEISTAHKNLLKRLYPKIKHPKYNKEDMLKTIKLQHYET